MEKTDSKNLTKNTEGKNMLLTTNNTDNGSDNEDFNNPTEPVSQFTPNIIVTSSNNFLQNNQNDYDDDVIKTTKKEFESKIIPYDEIRKTQIPNSVWLATYDELMNKTKLLSVVNKCSNSTIPYEWVAIHLNKFKVYFSESSIYNDSSNEIIIKDESISKNNNNVNNDVNKNTKVKAFLTEGKDSVSFVKLYLINKNQLLDIYKNYYGVNISETSDFEAKLNDLNENNKSIAVDKNNDHGNVLYLGELDSMKIVTASAFTQKPIAKPEITYLKSIYIELRKAFKPHSNYFIMYYTYMLDGVKSHYTVTDLIKIFYKEEKESSKTNNKLNSSNTNEEYTIMCNTFVGTNPDQLSLMNKALDLNYLPTFDDKSGDFVWSNNFINNNNNSINILNDPYLNTTNKSIFKSEDLNYKGGFDIRNGSMISLNSSILIDNENVDNNLLNTNPNLLTCNDNLKTNASETKLKPSRRNPEESEKQKIMIDELNNLLKKMDFN